MNEKDIENVYQIAIKSFGDPWSKESFLYSVNAESDYSIVALENDSVVGYAIMRISFDTADIADVAVDPDYRRRGIAALLMEKMLSYGKEVGVDTYVLEVRAGNEAAIKLYEGCGFQPEGVRKKYYTNPIEDAVIMCKHQN